MYKKNHFIFFIISSAFILSVRNLQAQKTLLNNDTVLAQEYLGLADSLEKNGEYDSATWFYSKSADHFFIVENWERFAHCKMRELFAFIDASEYQDAVKNITDAILRLNSKLPENNVFSFHCQVKKSLVYYQMEDFQRAKDNLKKAIATFSSNPEIDSVRGKKVLASAYFEYGNNYLKTGKLDSAIYMYKQTLEIRQKIFDENNELIVDCYNNLGIMYAYYGDYEMANTYMLKTLQAREKNYGFAHPQTAWTYINLAIFNLYSGDYGIALDYAYKSLKSREECLPPGHIEFASSYSTIANIYNETRGFDKSLEYNNLALNIYNDRFGEYSIQSASIYNNIADNYNKQKKYAESLEYFKKAYEIQVTESNNILTPSQILYELNIADTYLQMDQIDSAIFYNNKAYKSDFSPAFQNRNMEALLDFEFAFILLEQKAQIYIRKYTNFNEINDLKIAYKAYQDYLELLDYLKQRASEEESKLEIVRRNNSIMNDAVNLLYKLHQKLPDEFSTKEIGWLIEKNKSNVLLEMIDKSNKTKKILPDSISVKWKKMTGAVYELKTERDYLLSINSDTNISAITDTLFMLQNQLHSMNKFIRENYTGQTDPFQPNTFEENKEALKNNQQTAILNYYVSDSLLFIHIAEHDQEFLRTVSIDTLFQSMVKQYLNSLRKNRIARVNNLSYTLYNFLIQPVEELIKDKSKLVIVPDKILYYLPFETLSKDTEHVDFVKKEYLINRYEVVYHFSTTIYCNSLIYHKTDNNTNSSFVGFAPVFSNQGRPVEFLGETLSENIVNNSKHQEDLMRSISVDGKTYNSLPYSENEVKEITSLFEKKNFTASAFYFTDANKSNFFKLSKDYKIIHLASHGLINETTPKLSGILFYPTHDSIDSPDWKNNTILTAGEIRNIEIKADLVVLSACETGIGSVVNGEGVLSLTRALTMAGASNIMYTLWKVGDRNSYKLMIKFYEFYLNGDSYSQALRKAKLEMIKNEETAFPGNWGAFTLIAI
jgi:CHAT domain-containing protein